MEEKIIAKINEIKNILVDLYEPTEVGLMAGASGVSVFLAEYIKLFNDEKAIDKITKLLNYINIEQNKKLNKKEGLTDCGFCEGAAGVFWTQRHL